MPVFHVMDTKHEHNTTPELCSLYFDLVSHVDSYWIIIFYGAGKSQHNNNTW